ncbi:MAG: hypothetical protein A2017_00460 [Lentisphaerae bacterium GWF2_44_16]|nr:MAG: hypothetical protein A2017_00460 [Lentisphaerae bacterium GWF2_44_16]
MKKKALISSLKKISELLVLSDISDVQSLSKLHSAFEEMETAAEEASLAGIAEAAKKGASIVEKTVMGELQDAQSAIDALNKMVSHLQMYFEGKGNAELQIPDELKIYINGTEKASATQEKQAEDKKPEPLQDTENDLICASTAAAITSDPELVADFINESTEHLEVCNEHLLTIEASPEDEDALNAIFRAFHTIKGVSSFLNLNEIRKLAHQSENLFDKARSGQLTMTGEPMDITFESVDTMKLMIEDLRKSLKSRKPESNIKGLGKLFSRLENILVELNKEKSLKEEHRNKIKAPPTGTEENTVPNHELVMAELPQYLDEMKEHMDLTEANLLKIEGNPLDTDTLNSLFRSFHTIKGSSSFLGLKQIEELAHSAETFLDSARNGTLTLKGEPMDIIFHVLDAFRKIHETLTSALLRRDTSFSMPAFPGLLVRLHEHSSAPVKGNYRKAVTIKTEKASTASPGIKKEISEAPPVTQKAVLRDIVKVDSERLDKLLDTIGELVIAEAMVTQSPELRKFCSPALLQTLGHLNKITRELQSMGTYLRMVPVYATFQKMARLVRDLAKKIGKDIEFTMSGEDTELDKTVVDRIGDPLVHMVRNAVDHGIEADPEQRIKAGKAAKGKVSLKAYHKGGNIYIEVSDDGKGLNREAILKKAVEKGIVGIDVQMEDRDVLALIFAPGFSTAEKITEVSGRGVGMDVVKRNIEELRGTVEIQSEYGKGSTFTIRLPLTLAIIDGMIIAVGTERYIIPTLSIVMSINLNRKEIRTVQNRGEVISLQGELIPLFHLDRIFEIPQTEKCSDEILVVIVEEAGLKTGIAVDRLIGQQQIVIKNLGDYLKGMQGLSGGAIMPDGNVGLILDVGGLVKLANS